MTWSKRFRSARIFTVVAVGLLAASILLAGCTKTAAPTPTPGEGGAKTAGPQLINGAGATFPYPLYSKWFDEYAKINTGMRFNYQSIGSGGGIKQITEKTVDFGASDAPLTDEQLAKAPGLMHIPTVMGAVVVTYNLPDVKGTLKLTPETLAAIYLGQIKKWNDPKLVADNKDLNLPNLDIAVARRSDGSGTTNIFTDYLSSVSPEWKSKVGKGTSVNWPVGIGGKGNEGVAGLVKQTPGSIGYVELAYAEQNKLPYADLKNQAGKWVKPSIEGTTAAAAGAAANMPEDLRVSIVNAPGDTAYPIAGFTYILVYKDQTDEVKGKAVADFLWWAVHDGEKYASGLLYAPLPDPVLKKVEAKLRLLNVGGKPLLNK